MTNALHKLATRPFGNTGIAISPLGLGTVKLGRDQGVKYPTSFTIPDDRAASHLIALASDLGINLIDTAPAYGESEQRLGKLLKGQRQQWVICSKVGEEFVNGQSHFDFSAAHTRKSIERSLARLNTDVIDIVLVHSDGNDLEVISNTGALEALQRCKDEGLIRAFGVSTKTVAGGLLAAEQTDAVMVSCNLEYHDELPVIERCADLNRGVLVKKAFASGHLCAKQDNPVQRSMDFVLGQQGVDSIIVGTINPDHLTSNVAAAVKALKGNS